MALKSPVKCRLMSSIGTTWAYPPPAAPPFMPKTGPREGSRRQMIAFLPIWWSASPSPTVVVVLPSPAGAGLPAVTRISFPSGLSFSVSMYSSEIFALVCPYGEIADSGIPSLAAISRIGLIFAAWAISISLGTAFFFAPGATAVDIRDLLIGDVPQIRSLGTDPHSRNGQNGAALTRVRARPLPDPAHAPPRNPGSRLLRRVRPPRRRSDGALLPPGRVLHGPGLSAAPRRGSGGHVAHAARPRDGLAGYARCGLRGRKRRPRPMDRPLHLHPHRTPGGQSRRGDVRLSRRAHRPPLRSVFVLALGVAGPRARGEGAGLVPTHPLESPEGRGRGPGEVSRRTLTVKYVFIPPIKEKCHAQVRHRA